MAPPPPVSGAAPSGQNSGQSPGQRPGQRNVLAAAASGITDFISACGGDAERVLTQAGVPEQCIGNPVLPLDLGNYCAMMELAADDTGNDNFGLWYGQQFRPQALGLIGEIALAAPTLGAALDNLASLFPFHQQATETRLTRDGDLWRLEYRILDSRIAERRQDAELTMGMFANVFRTCLGSDWTPEEVQFEHLRPGTAQDHSRAFGAPVHFGQRTNCLVVRDRGFDRRMPGGDLARLSRLRSDLKTLTGGTGTVPFLARVQSDIRSRLPEGYPHIDDVAATLGMARWTLQRRLADEGLSFSGAVDGVRRDLAALYLSQTHVPMSDIAYLLGYSELSAFSRAFRRWFGCAPTRARARE
ncbi:AraC-like transcriptional regulator QhpR [Novispirillum itersonii]|uniref:AraC-like DNA-binding protein n=1 Tax=Novispirillum itersonii TaxID=189 RepID=A0A7X0DMH9_NOVIT|nr:AraC family transcriptional regulator [Novispirillum itersonii]MBB6209192.1 AraC-like DNA-binding protein [Novispirillum itersonii]